MPQKPVEWQKVSGDIGAMKRQTIIKGYWLSQPVPTKSPYSCLVGQSSEQDETVENKEENKPSQTPSNLRRFS